MFLLVCLLLLLFFFSICCLFAICFELFFVCEKRCLVFLFLPIYSDRLSFDCLSYVSCVCMCLSWCRVPSFKLVKVLRSCLSSLYNFMMAFTRSRPPHGKGCESVDDDPDGRRRYTRLAHCTPFIFIMSGFSSSLYRSLARSLARLYLIMQGR